MVVRERGRRRKMTQGHGRREVFQELSSQREKAIDRLWDVEWRGGLERAGRTTTKKRGRRQSGESGKTTRDNGGERREGASQRRIKWRMQTEKD